MEIWLMVINFDFTLSFFCVAPFTSIQQIEILIIYSTVHIWNISSVKNWESIKKRKLKLKIINYKNFFHWLWHLEGTTKSLSSHSSELILCSNNLYNTHERDELAVKICVIDYLKLYCINVTCTHWIFIVNMLLMVLYNFFV